MMRQQHKKQTIIKSLTMALFSAANVPLLVGCNTVEGIGEDLEEAGDEIEDAVS